jgi:hypothetical protein
MSRSRINYSAWMWRVVACDGALPLAVWGVPYVLPLLAPGEERKVSLAIILTAIGALLVRWYLGAPHIRKNHCRPGFQRIQFGCLVGALVVMVNTDALLMTIHDIGGPPRFEEVALLLAVPYAIYLTLMAVAMYPGREPIAAEGEAERVETIGNWKLRV